MKSIAIVTGASSGLGREFTKQISSNKDFDEIWIFARREDKLKALADEINGKNNFDIVRPVAMDVAGKDGALRFKEYIKAENKKLEIMESSIEIKLLINNAGFGTYGPFIETSPNKEMDMVELNCTTVTGICGYALPFMKKGSLIINTASLAAFMPLGNFAVYAATKSFVLSFSIALAAELKDKGIKVHALCPGSVSTEFANVASNGAREEVLGGISPEKVVSHCLKRAYKGKKTSILRLKWKFNAFLSRVVGRYTVARATFKYNKRPHNPDEDMIKKDEEIDLEEFL